MAITHRENQSIKSADRSHLAKSLNSRYRIQVEQQAARTEAALDFGGVTFETAFDSFVTKYIADYRLKSSTARLLRQRQQRLAAELGGVQVPAITTQLLREAVASSSQFEQSKLRTLLLRFFRYAKSTGLYPAHLTNPVDDLFIDPVPHKLRQRITIPQFRAIHQAAPPWLQWLMTLAFHLALRRIDLVNLRFEDIVGDRIVSPIRKTDTQARDIEATSVDFPVHPDVRRIIVEARRSSLRLGRCPFVIHREPERRTKRMADALAAGRLEHPAQVLPEYGSKAFNRARQIAMERTNLFDGLAARELPTLHEIRALSSHLYAKAGYEVTAVQDLMAHTDPDMTRAYQKGHARKVLRIDMMLPWSVEDDDCDGVREQPPAYSFRHKHGLRENSLGIL
jgi:enterobacteria phage integrase